MDDLRTPQDVSELDVGGGDAVKRKTAVDEFPLLVEMVDAPQDDGEKLLCVPAVHVDRLQPVTVEHLLALLG